MVDASLPRYCPACGAFSMSSGCPVCGTATLERKRLRAVAEEQRAGDVIAGRYRVLDVIGRGGFGAVYGAEHIATRQPLALKMLVSNPRSTPEEDIRRFFREAQVMANLRHPNTVRVFDVGQTEQGALFIAMERLNGPTLEELLDNRAAEPLSEDELIDVSAQVLGSLSEAHRKGLVHRDLKPANIMLTSVAGDVIAKVLDFGIVQARGSGLTAGGHAIGTPAFMSPEQCHGTELDGRSDLYALATTMYTAASGRLPLFHDVPLNLMMMQVNQVPLHLGAVTDTFSAAFCDLVMKNLAKDREDRCASADAMREELLALRGRGPRLRRQRFGIISEAIPLPETVTAARQDGIVTLPSQVVANIGTAGTQIAPAVGASTGQTLTPAADHDDLAPAVVQRRAKRSGWTTAAAIAACILLAAFAWQLRFGETEADQTVAAGVTMHKNAGKSAKQPPGPTEETDATGRALGPTDAGAVPSDQPDVETGQEDTTEAGKASREDVRDQDSADSGARAKVAPTRKRVRPKRRRAARSKARRSKSRGSPAATRNKSPTRPKKPAAKSNGMFLPD